MNHYHYQAMRFRSFLRGLGTPSRRATLGAAILTAIGFVPLGCGTSGEGSGFEILATGSGAPNTEPLEPANPGTLRWDTTSTEPSAFEVARLRDGTEGLRYAGGAAVSNLLIETADGLWFAGSEIDGLLGTPQLLVPREVRDGMRWTTFLAGRPAYDFSVSGGEEGNTIFGRRRIWTLTQTTRATGTTLTRRYAEGRGLIDLSGTSASGRPLDFVVQRALVPLQRDSRSAPSLKAVTPRLLAFEVTNLPPSWISDLSLVTRGDGTSNLLVTVKPSTYVFEETVRCLRVGDEAVTEDSCPAPTETGDGPGGAVTTAAGASVGASTENFSALSNVIAAIDMSGSEPRFLAEIPAQDQRFAVVKGPVDPTQSTYEGLKGMLRRDFGGKAVALMQGNDRFTLFAYPPHFGWQSTAVLDLGANELGDFVPTPVVPGTLRVHSRRDARELTRTTGDGSVEFIDFDPDGRPRVHHAATVRFPSDEVLVAAFRLAPTGSGWLLVSVPLEDGPLQVWRADFQAGTAADEVTPARVAGVQVKALASTHALICWPPGSEATEGATFTFGGRPARWEATHGHCATVLRPDDASPLDVPGGWSIEGVVPGLGAFAFGAEPGFGAAEPPAFEWVGAHEGGDVSNRLAAVTAGGFVGVVSNRHGEARATYYDAAGMAVRLVDEAPLIRDLPFVAGVGGEGLWLLGEGEVLRIDADGVHALAVAANALISAVPGGGVLVDVTPFGAETALAHLHVDGTLAPVSAVGRPTQGALSGDGVYCSVADDGSLACVLADGTPHVVPAPAVDQEFTGYLAPIGDQGLLVLGDTWGNTYHVDTVTFAVTDLGRIAPDRLVPSRDGRMWYAREAYLGGTRLVRITADHVTDLGVDGDAAIETNIGVVAWTSDGTVRVLSSPSE